MANYDAPAFLLQLPMQLALQLSRRIRDDNLRHFPTFFWAAECAWLNERPDLIRLFIMDMCFFE